MFHLIQDWSENFPAFEDFLYSSLDYQIVVMEILWFFLLDSQFANPLLSIAITFVIERVFRWLRASLGEKNLSKKTFIDDCFFM